MAAILIGAGALAYDQVKKSKQKRAAKKAHNDARFATLERETTARLSSPPPTYSCACTSPSWPGGECPSHGYIPARSTAAAAGLARQNSASSSISSSLAAAAGVGVGAAPPYSEEPVLPVSPVSPISPRGERDSFGGGGGARRAPSYSNVTAFQPGMAGRGGGGDGVANREMAARRPSYRSQSSALSGNFVSISSGGGGGGAGGGEGSANKAAYNDSTGYIGGEKKEEGGSWWRRKGRKAKKGGAPEIGGGSGDGDWVVR